MNTNTPRLDWTLALIAGIAVAGLASWLAVYMVTQ